jgi:hypothetical protein
MFKFIKNLRNKNVNSKNFKRDMAKRLDGRAIKYVTERTQDNETVSNETVSNDSVIGRDGALILKGDELLVYSSADVVFRVKVDEMSASELLSMEGVILTGSDIEHGGIERTVIAYYTYYLKPGKGL